MPGMTDPALTPLESWHFFAFLALLAAFGVLGHVVRGFVNPIPDRLSDSDAMDMILSDGYSMNDRIFGTEYDDYGYYRLDSFKNLRLSITLTMIFGAIGYLFCGNEAAHLFAWAANNAVAWTWDMMIYRVQNLMSG